MSKNRIQAATKRKKRTDTATVIADIAGVSPRHVRLVQEGKRENKNILDATIIYEEGKNELLKMVEQLVPFTHKKKSA